MKNRKGLAIFSIGLLLLLACNSPVRISATFTPEAPTLTPAPAHTITPTVTITPTEVFSGQCGYMWANQELPEVSQQLKEAFQKAGLTEIEARASAYGENCYDSVSNKVVSFSAMQTDFYLIIPVQDTGDTQAMGGWIEKVLPVIDQFPPGQVPGPNPGYIGIRFTGTPGEQNLWFQRQKAQQARADGLSGSALYDALLNP